MIDAKPSSRRFRAAGSSSARFADRLWTYEELLTAVPESIETMELWDGELLMSPTPSFQHQEIVDRMHDRLKAWVRSRGLGKTVTAPMDMILTARRVTQPDVLFISTERLAIIQDRVRGAADLVVEVISPGSRQRDRINKRDLYEQHGVREYWIIDPEAETVEVLFLTRGEYRLTGRWKPGEHAVSRLLAGFTVSVAELFSKD